MKKITGVVVGMAVVIVSVIVGIASLPDKILIEPPSFETSQNPSEEDKITLPSESISSNEWTESNEDTPVEPVEQTESEEDNSEEKVIKVKISDGVGSGDK